MSSHGASAVAERQRHFSRIATASAEPKSHRFRIAHREVHVAFNDIAADITVLVHSMPPVATVVMRFMVSLFRVCEVRCSGWPRWLPVPGC